MQKSKVRMVEQFKEKPVTPTSITLGEDKTGEYYDIRTKEGIAERVRDARVQWRIVRFYKKYTKYKRASEIKEFPESKVTQILTSAAKEAEKELVFLYAGEDLVNIVSRRHKQVPQQKIRAEVEKAIKAVFGETKPIQSGMRTFSYKMNMKNEYVSPYASVFLGSNLALGRCAVTIFTRIQTISPLAGSVPCLNWAQFWGEVTQWFGVSVERLKIEIPAPVHDLFQREIHTTRMEIKAADLITPLKEMQDAVTAFKPTIDTAVNSKLLKGEMEAILSAYSNKVGLAQYLIDQVLENVEAETIWGFSNAVSYARTHGEFRSEEGFDSRSAWKLERIAGEVVSLTPTIIKLKKEYGEITKEFLLAPPKELVAQT